VVSQLPKTPVLEELRQASAADLDAGLWNAEEAEAEEPGALLNTPTEQTQTPLAATGSTGRWPLLKSWTLADVWCRVGIALKQRAVGLEPGMFHHQVD